MYPEEMVKPMRAELNDAGFQDLYSADEVKNAKTFKISHCICRC